jgi:hypothetical protein
VMGQVLLVCVIAMFGLMFLVLVDRYRLEQLRYELAELRDAAENRAAAESVSKRVL